MSSFLSAVNLPQPNSPAVIRCPHLPLAVYREVSAHLRQCAGVTAELLPQLSSTFDYRQSQVGGLIISCTSDIAPLERQQLEAILQHYGARYGPWELMEGQPYG